MQKHASWLLLKIYLEPARWISASSHRVWWVGEESKSQNSDLCPGLGLPQNSGIAGSAWASSL